MAFSQAQAPKGKAAPPDIQRRKAVPSGIPHTDDIEPLVSRLIAGEKREFETTEQFEARQNSLIQPGKQYAFVFDSKHDADFTSYDADEAVMTVHLNLHRPFSKDYAAGYYDVLIKDIVRRTGGYIGQNAFGASVVVESRTEDDFGVEISDEDAERFWQVGTTGEATCSFPLSIGKAKEMKQNLRVVLVGTVPDGTVYQDGTLYPATVSSPVELRRHQHYVDFRITEVRIVDSRNGSVVARVVPNAPASEPQMAIEVLSIPEGAAVELSARRTDDNRTWILPDIHDSDKCWTPCTLYTKVRGYGLLTFSAIGYETETHEVFIGEPSIKFPLVHLRLLHLQ
jgi:hypothetical protein